jgi:hypothetical protein
MPILLKKIEARIISLFGGDSGSDFTAKVRLVNSVVGKVGVENYIELEKFTAFTQDFSNVEESYFCDEIPLEYGLKKCNNYINLNISY